MMSSRSGTVLICVLACMLVAISLCVASLQASLRMRKEARTYRQIVQAEWLLDAGVRLAQQKLMSVRDYSGEQLEIQTSDPDRSPGKAGSSLGDAGTILIDVERDGTETRVKVTARLAKPSQQATQDAEKIQRSATFSVSASERGGEPDESELEAGEAEASDTEASATDNRAASSSTDGTEAVTSSAAGDRAR